MSICYIKVKIYWNVQNAKIIILESSKYCPPCSIPRFEINLFQVLPRAGQSEDLTRLQWCLSTCLFHFSEGSGWLGQEGCFPGISEWMRTPLWYCRRSLHGIFNGISRPRITHSYINRELHFVSVAADSPTIRWLERQDRMRQDQINLYGVPFR